MGAGGGGDQWRVEIWLCSVIDESLTLWPDQKYHFSIEQNQQKQSTSGTEKIMANLL